MPAKKSKAVAGRKRFKAQRLTQAVAEAPVAPAPRPKRSTFWKNLGSLAGGAIGGVVAPQYAATGAQVLGDFAHRIAKMWGSGDYKTNMNSMPMQNNLCVGSSQAPSMISRYKKNIFRHREFLGDIISSSSANTFNLQSFPVNPGQSATFPWFSGVASNYNEYKVHGLIFEFRTMSCDALNSTNTALGQVIMAANYNASQANFVNKAQMENYEFAISCKPSQSAICAIECARPQTVMNELYVRYTSVPSGQDQRLYDICNFQIATNGIQGTSVNVGELWVSYEIELLKENLVGGALGYTLPQAHYIGVSASGSQPFGASASQYFDNIGLTITTGGSPLIAWPAAMSDGYYMIIMNWKGSAATASVPTFTATNGSFVSRFAADGAGGVSSTNGLANQTDCTQLLYLHITAPGCTVSASTGGTLPSSPQFDLFVVQMNALIVN